MTSLQWPRNVSAALWSILALPPAGGPGGDSVWQEWRALGDGVRGSPCAPGLGIQETQGPRRPRLQSHCPANTNSGGNSEDWFLFQTCGTVFLTYGCVFWDGNLYSMETFTDTQSALCFSENRGAGGTMLP